MPTTNNKPLIIITGSSGLLGTAIQERLVTDYDLVGLDVKEPEHKPDAADFMKCDLTDDTNVNEVLTKIRDEHADSVAAVIHLAAYYDFSGEPSPMYEKLTVEGSRRLIKGLQKTFKSVDRFIFSSSLLVMEPVEDEKEGPITEESDTEGDWDYPQSKLEAEKALKEDRGDIPVTVLRIAGVYTDNCGSIPIAQHIRRIYEKELESYLFPGDKEHGQPFIHLDDLADCVGCAVSKRKADAPWEMYLVAEPEVMSHEDLQERIGTLIHGKEWPTLRVPKTVAKAGAWAKEKVPWEDPFIKPWMVDMADDHYPVQIERARTRLQWDPNHRLNDELAGMIDFLKRDPKAFYEENNLEWDDGDKK